MNMYIPQCIRPVSAAISVHPDLPIPATSLTDRAEVASRSSSGCRYGPVSSTHRRRAGHLRQSGPPQSAGLAARAWAGQQVRHASWHC